MKTFNTILTQFFFLFSGMTFSSLCISHSNTWKVYLPIILLIAGIKFVIYDFKNKE